MTGEGVAAVAAACASAGFVLDRLFHPARKIGNRFEEFLDDWNGKPARKSLDGAVTLDERRPGVVEQIHEMRATQQADSERLAKVEQQLNGGGLGSQMTELGAQVAQMDARQREHLDQAEASKNDITEDIRETRRFVAEAVVTMTTNQQRLEEHLGQLDEKVEQRLFVVEEAERTHRAMLHEVGFDLDPPDDAA